LNFQNDKLKVVRYRIFSFISLKAKKHAVKKEKCIVKGKIYNENKRYNLKIFTSVYLRNDTIREIMYNIEKKKTNSFIILFNKYLRSFSDIQ